jgi:pimeloyl-ACP methyl ester carboxylesterase
MTEGYAEIAGARLWYWDTGGDGPALILCHPASQGALIWEHQRDAFADAGYRVIGYSRRGHHPSDTGPANQPGTTIGDLDALCRFLGIETAHLLGAAAGGITALGFACRFPERVSGLILAGTIFAPDEEEWRALYARLGIAALHGIAPTEFLELGPAYRAGNPEGVATFAALAHQATAGKTGFAQPTGAEVTWARMERLTMPVLLLTGEADLYAPPPMQELIARHLAKPTLATLRAVGHAPYWEAPEAFNADVLEFLRGIRAGTVQDG